MIHQIDLDRLKIQALAFVCASLVVTCGVLGLGWWSAESDKEVMQAEKERILTLYTLVAGLAEDAGFVVDTLREALTAENQRLYLEGPRKLLGIAAPPEAGR